MQTKNNSRPSGRGRSGSFRKRSSSNNSNGSRNSGGSRSSNGSRNSSKSSGGSKNFRSSRTRGSSRGGARGGSSRRGGGGRKMPTFDPSQFINKNPIELKEEIYKPKNTFETFGLNEKIAKTVIKLGITIPSPIQDKIIPEILKGNDVIGLAETGTGKTAAFLLPLLEKTINDMERQTLIMAPTRELAIQIVEELKKLSYGFPINSVTCVGGININPQIKLLKRNNQFIIGTPGRLLDLMKRKCFDPSKITTVVLDEADRMLDMGFIGDMRSILSATPKDRETLFFSATIQKETEKLVHDFLRNPVTISVKKKDVTDSIAQDIVTYPRTKKFETLENLFTDNKLTRVMIFCGMKHAAEKLSKDLSRDGIKAESIHGNKRHVQRQRALQSFKNGTARVLVATDVAARGIHVDNVSHVINYDLPQTFEDYVHRIGRTGRGTKRGQALTFVAGRD